ncbi:restriction endonuclease subunit S [Mesosutterella sp. OilRF-GAM-744-9]|uniref:Restriction endonuclease subunit S n=1 Tax=Mesosutterella porci TaxID=2915351 RepID=A0ABS9MRT8_9BURK|nr:restriction endonuclease subunit S [Mesosutterella sp. oilRF-744-WT-GAM-9]MCG5031347.1 restriction endonuclease subunit S [Mesosutterella sp. oilRF-744-WT-GAM-9]
MNIEAVKSALISLAIRGKLVPQRDDEPEVEQIGEAPKVAPFEIPAKWKWVKLTAISSAPIKYGYTASASAEGNAKFLRITDITTAGVNWDTVPYCKIEKDKENKFLLDSGDILIARTGGTIGKSFLVDFVNQKTVFASYLLRIRVSERLASPVYIQRFLGSPFYWQQVASGSKGTGQPNINAKTLGSLSVPLPPLAEQRRIVAKLEELLEPLSRVQERLGRLTHDFPEQFKAAVLQKAIQGKLVPQRDDEPEVEQIGEAPKVAPFEIPAKWKWVKLTAISSAPIKYGYTASASAEGNAKFLRITDITTAGVNWDTVPYCKIEKDKENKFLLDSGDILIARTGGTIGKSFLVDFVNQKTVFASYLLRIRVSERLASPVYIQRFLGSPFYWQQVASGSKGTGQPNINAKTLGSLSVPLPPLAEQRRIVAKVEQLFSQVDELTARLSS